MSPSSYEALYEGDQVYYGRIYSDGDLNREVCTLLYYNRMNIDKIKSILYKYRYAVVRVPDLYPELINFADAIGATLFALNIKEQVTKRILDRGIDISRMILLLDVFSPNSIGYHAVLGTEHVEFIAKEFNELIYYIDHRKQFVILNKVNAAFLSCCGGEKIREALFDIQEFQEARNRYNNFRFAHPELERIYRNLVSNHGRKFESLITNDEHK